MRSTTIFGLGGSRRLLLLAFLTLLARMPGQAQPRPAAAPPTPPQLWQALREHPQPDTARVRLLLQLEGVAYSQLPPDRLDSLAQQALLLSRQLNFPDGQAAALLRRFGVGFRRGTPPDLALLRQALPLAARSADKRMAVYVLSSLATFSPGQEGLPYLLRARAAAQATGQPVLLARAYLNESRYFNLMLHDNYQALQAASRVLPVARRAGLALEEVQALEAIGDVYVYLNDYEQARASYQQELPLARALPDTTLRTRWECTALTGLADCDRFSGRYAPAIAAYQQALRLARFPGIQLLVKVRVADTYERQHSPLALPYARQVLRETSQLPANSYTSTVCATLGYYFLRTGRPDSAVYYGRRALGTKGVRPEKEVIRDAVLLLAEAYGQLRQYGPAYAYQRRYAGLRDSLNSEATTRQATAARFADDMARQKSQIGLLTRNQQLQADAARRQRLLLFSALAVLALLGGLGVVLWRANRLQQRANEQLRQLNQAVMAQRGELQTQRDQLDASLTELRATQAQLIQSAKMASLGELTAGIAHEIQNPLNFVNNFAEVSAELVVELKEAQAAGDAEEVAALADDLEQNLGKIGQHGQQAANIVRGMLEHSRTSSAERRAVNLNRLADEYLRLAYQGLRAKDKSFNATLETDFDPDLPRTTVVVTDVGRVLLNLFSNAFYAVKQRQQAGKAGYAPTVAVSTKQVGNQVEIRVSDNGTGIPAAVQAKIFQPFFTTKPTGEGTGLGLSLSYDIITKAHGGTLTMESQPGQGTTFLIILPA